MTPEVQEFLSSEVGKLISTTYETRGDDPDGCSIPQIACYDSTYSISTMISLPDADMYQAMRHAKELSIKGGDFHAVVASFETFNYRVDSDPILPRGVSYPAIVERYGRPYREGVGPVILDSINAIGVVRGSEGDTMARAQRFTFESSTHTPHGLFPGRYPYISRRDAGEDVRRVTLEFEDPTTCAQGRLVSCLREIVDRA